MNKRAALLVIVMLFSIIAPSTATAAGGTVTKSYTATQDTMDLRGHQNSDGIYNNVDNGLLYIGMGNKDGSVNVRNKMGVVFDLGVPEGNIVSAELVLTMATVIRNPGHTLYMEVRGSAANELDHDRNGTFPSVDTNSPYADKFTAMGTYLENQSITLNVKSAVDAFTDTSDRKITFTLNGNEADADSGRFEIHSLETSGKAEFKPKLVVTYETGPVNTPPTGSFAINEGAVTGYSTVNLSVTGSDPDAGDSVTHMRFANSAADLSAASWLPFSNTATFNLTGGDGAKTIYMQLRDSNNAISANSSQTILLDQTAPTVTGVTNDGIYKTSVTVTFNEGTATLNGAAFVSGAQVALDGVYTLVVTDAAGNVKTVSFQIDKVAPTVTGVANNGNYKEAVTVTFDEGTATLNSAPYSSGTKVVLDGSYTLVVTDAAGNETTVSFKIDTEAPTVTGVTAGEIYKAKVTPSFNEGTATLNGAAFTSGTEVVLDGSYTLVVTDAAGNVATVSFVIDKTAPVVTGVSNGGFYKSGTTVGFNEGTATLNGAAFIKDTEIDQDGAYALVVTDAAGNVTTINFTIDSLAPVVTGVTDGGVYKEKKKVEFNEGTATLNGAAFTSGTEIEQDDVYTLVVTDQAGNVTTVGFEIDKIAPTITGVIDGEMYNTKVTPSFNEGTATLNGAPYTTGTAIEHDGSYTLRVTDEAGNVTTIEFEIKIKGSNNASLSSLALGGIKLDQAVTSSVYTYTATVPNSTTVTQATYTTADSNATVELQLNGRSVINPIYLREGTNNISVIVTAQDGTKQTYTIYVTRLTDGGTSGGSSGGSSSGTTIPGANVPTKPESKPVPETSKPKTTIFNKSVSYLELLSFLEDRIAQSKSNPATPELTDTSNHWSKDTISLLAQLGFISGYEDASFKPDASITRAEFAKIITNIFKFNPNSKPSSTISDIDNHWAREPIYTLVSLGIIAGYTDNTFQPDKPITRAEIIAIISRIVDLNAVSKGTLNLTFTDIEGSWNADQILAAVEAGIVQGRNSTTFVPNDKATRAEACAIILRTLELDPVIQALFDQLK